MTNARPAHLDPGRQCTGPDAHAGADSALLDRNQAEPFTDEAIAKALRCHRNTVGSVRRRFVAADLPTALYHKPPPRAPRKITGAVEASLIALACSTQHNGRQQWKRRSAGERVSHGTLKGLKPEPT